MGMSPSHQDDDAGVCIDGGDTHGQAIGCTKNYPNWLMMLQ